MREFIMGMVIMLMWLAVTLTVLTVYLIVHAL